jgi:TetR/AcrR family transcriptional regulator, transcriptional repressor for nem operon
VGHSQADKIATHQRIVDIAAKRFRELGLDGISVADIMKEAGLTVGGFYKHFRSRDELVAEAISVALKDIEHWQVAIATSPRQAVRGYLSEAHRDELSTSCPLSALVNDTSRSTDAARDVYTAGVKRVLDLLEKSFPGDEAASNRPQALLVASACVGALTMSRAVSDPKLSKQILDGVVSQLLELYSSKRARA